MDVVNEILDLKRRLGELEGAFNVLTGQLRHIHPDLTQLKLDAKTNFESLSGLMGRFDERMVTFERRVSSVDLQVWSLRDDLPVLIGDAVRVALSSHR